MAVRQGTDDIKAIRSGFSLEVTAQRFNGSGGSLERLARVRLRTLPFCRNDSRTRMAGGELRFLMVSTYMASRYRVNSFCKQGKMKIIYDLHGYRKQAKMEN